LLSTGGSIPPVLLSQTRSTRLPRLSMGLIMNLEALLAARLAVASEPATLRSHS